MDLSKHLGKKYWQVRVLLCPYGLGYGNTRESRFWNFNKTDKGLIINAVSFQLYPPSTLRFANLYFSYSTT